MAMANTIPALGTIFGSAFGSVLMQSGRARAFKIALSIGIASSTITLIQNWTLFLICKFFVGVSVGLTGVIVARYIEEYVPLKWFGLSQAISLTFLQVGVVLSTMIGVILPDEDDAAGLAVDGCWRIVFIIQPLLYLLVLFLFKKFIGGDPPKFYLLTGQDAKAREAIDKLYQTKGDEAKIGSIT